MSKYKIKAKRNKKDTSKKLLEREIQEKRIKRNCNLISLRNLIVMQKVTLIKDIVCKNISGGKNSVHMQCFMFMQYSIRIFTHVECLTLA